MNGKSTAKTSENEVVRIGVAGVGAAGRAFLPAIAAHAGCKLVAIAEPAEKARIETANKYDATGYSTVQAMLEHPELDAIYIGTPTETHPEHVLMACAAGKHVLVEKPMAPQLDQAKAMVIAAEQAGVVFLVGHSHSYDLPIHTMRDIIEQGTLGAVRMVNTWCYTDWIYRPRRPDELDARQGGGVTYRQGAHQFDIIRLLCGGMARSVRAKTFDFDPNRSAIGAHTAFLDFDNGAVATAIYNGYGRFSSMDLSFNVSEWGFMQPPETRPPMYGPSAGLSREAEAAAKQKRAVNAIPATSPYQPFFGLTLVSCERGDIRQSPTGLIVYTQDGQTEITLPDDCSPRDLVMAEFYDAITGRTKATHDGRWGLANLEVCTAAINSSESRREVLLTEQVAINRRL